MPPAATDVARRCIVRRILKPAAIVALTATALGVGALVYVAVQRSKDLTLPAPAGVYAVGRLITTWTDESRRENLGGTAGDHRTLSVWIWYPADRNGSTVPYMPANWARAREADRGIGSLLFQALGSIHGHATDARPTSHGGPFPVLVFEPGLGPLIPEYTTLAEDLASRGYVVIGLNPTYSASITVLGGHVIKQSALGTIPEAATPEQTQQRGDALAEVWAADDRLAIDQATRMNRDPSGPFVGRLDVHHVGLLGHSFGGAAALEACRLDPRCTAAADLDGWPYGAVVHSRLDRPVLLMSSEPGNDAGAPATLKANRDLAAISVGAPEAYQVSIKGARHFNFTDSALGFNPAERLIGVLGSINGVRGLRITSEYLAAFFDQTLKGQASPLLQSTSRDYPEVQFTAHRP